MKVLYSIIVYYHNVMITVKAVTVASVNYENYLQHKTAAFSDVMPCSLIVYYAQKQWSYVSPLLLYIYVVVLSS